MSIGWARLVAAVGLAVVTAFCGNPASARTAAVLDAGLPGEDSELVWAVTRELASAGYSVSRIGDDVLGDPSRLASGAYDLLVLTNGSALPLRATAAIDAYARKGGDIIALNAPLWQRPLVRVGGRWTTPGEYARESAGVLPDHIVNGFGPDEMKVWERSTNKPENPTTIETVSDGPGPGLRALHVLMSDLQGWDMCGSPKMEKPFPDGHTLTVFSAKGGRGTTQMSVEWVEKDGSRWIAVIPLTTEWTRYVLTPKDFHFWQSVPTRGGKDDQFHPENADRMSLGLTFTHTGWTPGKQEYWVGPIGTAKRTAEYEEILGSFDPPALDTLSPGYKCFDSTGVSRLVVRGDQTVVGNETLPVPSTVRSPQPRPRGAGFAKSRDWRWIPLVNAETSNGQWRGAPVTLTVNASGPYKGGVWASFTIGDVDWYKSPSVLRMIGKIAGKMSDGLFIIDGGSDFFTYFTDQTPKIGATIANVGPGTRSAVVRVSVQNAKTHKQAFTKDWRVSLEPGQEQTISETWRPASWSSDGYTVNARVVDGARSIDAVWNDFYVWTPKKHKEFVTIKDGDFILGGKRWRAHGVNYMMSSGTGTEDGPLFGNWLDARSYDPEVIERDLSHIADMGMNAVSIFTFRSYMESGNLLDMLRRLDNHGLKANVSLRPFDPLTFDLTPMKEMIDYYRLRDNDTVFAYDLCWEPMFGGQENRKYWDGEWERWVVERYGSIEAAEKDWGFPIPRDGNGKVTNPNAEQVGSHGEWFRMMAAYRRFLDTLLYTKYAAARRLVKSVDPNHHVSFRMAEGGNPEYAWGENIPYDFPYLAGAVDFLSPEAYGRVGDWERVKPGWFQFEYARWADHRKPMIWAEMGVSTWENGCMASTPDRQQFQADYFQQFYNMMVSSASDGIFFWFYPGGFRFDEKSDFGIINPDGSDRAVTKVIRDNSRRFIDGPDAKTVDYWIQFDRDSDARGIGGLYPTLAPKFWAAIKRSHAPGLKTPGTGTTSANCPLLAVGNTPITGSNPAKYLDAAFDGVEIRTADGKWIRVERGGSVTVRPGKPVEARVSLTNLGEAQWLDTQSNAGKAGTVYIIAEADGKTHQMSLPGSVGHLESTASRLRFDAVSDGKPVGITLTMLAEGRTKFGERFRFTVVGAK